MARLTDPKQLEPYVTALEWECRFTGYVNFTRRANEELSETLPGYSQKAVVKIMYDYVANRNGEVDRTDEPRSEYKHFGPHYDLRIPIEHRKIYFETRLVSDDPEDPQILVVRVKDA
jgi:hypothetical protein